MAYRYTNTDKWNDSWFLGLKPIEKLLFNYLCDNCDIAGFIELHFPTISVKIGCRDNDLRSALNGLTSRLYFSADNQVIYIRNFLEHQKNLPLNENNKCHTGIIDRLQKNLQKFEFELIEDFFKAPSKPLQRGYGNGIGNGIGINTSFSSSLKDQENFLKSEIEHFLPEFGSDMCNQFYLYWTEPNPSKTKCRYNMQKTWDTHRRLMTWQRNQKTTGKSLSNDFLKGRELIKKLYENNGN